VAARPQADGAAQCLVDLLPDSMQTPLAEGRIGGLPRRILAWEIAPGTPSAQDVKEGVDEQPQRLGARPTTPLWRRQQRRQLAPLGISQVTGIEDCSIRWRARHTEVSPLEDARWLC
jgi:hypothetical protein